MADIEEIKERLYDYQDDIHPVDLQFLEEHPEAFVGTASNFLSLDGHGTRLVFDSKLIEGAVDNRILLLTRTRRTWRQVFRVSTTTKGVALFAPEYGKAIMGVVNRNNDDGTYQDVVAYDLVKVHAILMRGGMDEEEASEWISYNVTGGYLGKGTPVFVEPLDA